jgi:hypothetical protein
VAAVVGWEMSTLGNPITDIAMMCVYRHPTFDLVLGDAAAWSSPRLPPADNIAQRYAVASGRELIDWNFYLALAYFKLAVIAEGPPPPPPLDRARQGLANDRDTVSKDKRRAIEHTGVQRKTVYKHHDLVAVIDQYGRQPIPSTSPQTAAEPASSQRCAPNWRPKRTRSKRSKHTYANTNRRSLCSTSNSTHKAPSSPTPRPNECM